MRTNAAKAVTTTVPHGDEPFELEDVLQLHPPLSSEAEAEDGAVSMPGGTHLPLGSHTFGRAQSSSDPHDVLQPFLQT